ncbi:hypothetical protein FACS1894184_13170 [Clostridia bacterium]|nr:hypothetical protein FACS1894184_13170 [Clostridia bacterium]
MTITGLYLNGFVKSRTRRTITKNDTDIEIISYLVADNNGNTYVLEDFSPPSYYEVNSRIEVPVYIKPYQRRNGVISFTVNVRRDSLIRGESF